MQKLIEKLGLSESVASAALWIILSLVLLAVVALLAMWLVRTLRPSLNMNGANRGGRPQRLAITDAFPLDREGRKLVIVRRDNTEHLLLIGGPTDVVVESNITRFDRSARGQARMNEPDYEEAAPAPTAPVMPVVAPAPVAPPTMPLVPRKDEAERRPAPMVAPPVLATLSPSPAAPAPAAPAPMAPPPAPVRPAPPPPAPPMLTLESLLEEAPAAPAPEAAPRAPEPPPAPAPAPAPVVEAPAPVAPPAPPPAPVQPAAPAQPRPPAMSEMARRLNEALQKPMSGTLRPPFNRSIPPAPPTAGPSASPTPPVTPVAPPAPPAPPPAPVVEPPPPAPEPKVATADPAPPPKADMDLLEEEMARLLGRPSQPKKPDAS